MITALKTWVAWVARNPELALLLLAAAVFGYMRIEARWLKNRLDKAQAREAAMKEELDAHETRNEVDNRVAAERDARERLHRDWSE